MINTIDLKYPVCLDIETTGLDRFRDEITSIQIGFTNVDQGEYVRRFFDWKKLGMKRALMLLTKLKDAKLVTHNGKFDLLFLYVKTGVELKLWVDTLVMAHVCGEEELGLKPLTKKYFKVDYDISKEAKTGKITEKFKAYGLDDVYFPMELVKIFKKKLKIYSLEKVYKHEMRVYKAYLEVEKNGVPISPRRHEIAKKLQEQYKPILERLLTVGNINWNSTAQVAKILFTDKDVPVYDEKGEKLPNTYEVIEYSFMNDIIYRGEFDTRKGATLFMNEWKEKNPHLYDIKVKLKHNYAPVIIGYGVGLKAIEKTAKGVPSVGSDVLVNYVGNHVVDDLLEYRRLTKLETFIKSWEEIQVDDRIYPSFNITARTGRTTCNNPNLQNIPQDKNVRNLIEARPGWKILECFSGDTEVLTERGWQRLDSLDKSLKVAQYDTESREITFEKPLQYIHHKDRETFSYEDRHTSLCATANHNMLTVWGKDYDVAKHKFKDVRFSRGNAFINAGFYHNGASNEFQSRYIAMFTADGSKSEKGYVTFCFSKERKVERCKYILNMLGIEYSFSKIIRSNGVVNYNFYIGKRTDHLLKGFVDRDKKLTMNCIHNLDIKAFLDEVQYWDATYTVARGKQTVRFTTCMKETAEVVQLMCNLQGKKSTIRIDDHNKKVTNGKHSRVYYLSYKRHRNDPHTFMSGEVVDFTKPTIQDVYCVTMPKGTVVIRHNGKVSIQGNCDLSQVELRVASIFSGDENMQHAYQSGSDLHSKTTLLLFGDTSDLSKQEQKRKRTYSKSANFGFLYGMSAKTFVQYAKNFGLNITEENSEHLRENFFKAYPTLLTWHEDCIKYARANGYTWSPIGRKRFLPNINSSNFRARGQAERQSINSGVQGFASDMCTSALADIVFSDKIDHDRCIVLGSVHDAILFEIRDDYVEEVAPKLKYTMEHPSILEGLDIPIPIIADVEVAQAWGG